MRPVKVECKNIALAYGEGPRKTPVLKDISLTIEPGELFALLGASGSGKSSLLRFIAGFNVAQSGELRVDGSDITNVAPWRRNIGMVFQNYALWPHLTVEKNVAFGLEERKLPRAEIIRKVADVLALVGLTDFAHRRPSQLSGGQQQRVALARTLAVEPKLLLLDEPLSNLDAKLRVQMRQELKTLQRRLGITTIFVTHDQEEAMTMASRIAVMSEGRFVQIGAPTQVYETPATRFVADFIGNVNLMDGMVTAHAPDHLEITCADCRHQVEHGVVGSVTATVGTSVTVALRPEKIRIGRDFLAVASEGAQHPGDVNRVRGSVKNLAYFGAFTVFHLQLDSGLVLKISASNIERQREEPLTVGDTAWASWSPSSQVVLTA